MGLIFTLLMTYGGALVAFFNPFVGLLIYICFAIVKPPSMWHWSVPAGPYSRIVAVALLVGWLLKGCGDWEIGRAKGMIVALVGFWLWAAIGVPMTPSPDLALGFIEAIAKIVLPVLVGITTIRSVRQLKQLAWVIALSEGYVAFEFNFAYILQGYNRVYTEYFGGMDNNCVSVAMVSCLGLSFFLGLRAERWWMQALAFGGAACMVHTVLFSFSRGGMLGIIVTSLVVFYITPKNPRYYAYFAVGVIIALRLAGPQVQERFSTIFVDKGERDASAQSRVELWSQCVEAMARNPVFGFGADHWALTSVAEFGWAKPKEAHSLWMQTGAELGVPGLLCLLSYYGICIVRLWPLTRERYAVFDPWLRDAARMVVASLIGFMVSAQFVSLEVLEEPYYIALLGAGVLKLTTPGYVPWERAIPAVQAAGARGLAVAYR